MKALILVFLSTIIFFMGCNEIRPPLVITGAKTPADNGFMLFKTTAEYSFHGSGSVYGRFWDSIGKYTIGDTIYFTKKR